MQSRIPVGAGIDRTAQGAIVAAPSNKMSGRLQLAVIGGGPAGLRAAEVAAATGVPVALFDAEALGGPQVSRRRKGRTQPDARRGHGAFHHALQRPGPACGIWRGLLEDFDAAALRAWAAELGVETFQATSGRVYPSAQGRPLLRRWIARLKGLGVRFEMHHRWSGLRPGMPACAGVRQRRAELRSRRRDLALGGGSWPQTGSDGGWIDVFKNSASHATRSLPANCGWEILAAGMLAAAEGKPLKNSASAPVASTSPANCWSPATGWKAARSINSVPPSARCRGLPSPSTSNRTSPMSGSSPRWNPCAGTFWKKPASAGG